MKYVLLYESADDVAIFPVWVISPRHRVATLSPSAT
jgi:hypothetical protein